MGSLQEYHEKRNFLIKLLGAKCVQCGAVEKLEFDHIDPASKLFTIAQLNSKTDEQILNEVRKCQLLCKTCHNKKTAEELGYQFVKGQDIHGTLGSYRYCKCSICRERNNEYIREYRKTHSRKKY